MIRSLLTLILLLGLVGPVGADTTAYVVNTNGETLSKIDLATGQVTQNIVSLGSDINSAPNQITIIDTLALVVNSTTNEIQVIDLRTETTAGFIGTGASSNPFWLVPYDTSIAYVSLLLGNAVLKVNFRSSQLLDTIPVGKSPAGVAIAEGKIYVANSGFDFGTFLYDPGTVSVIDPSADTVVATIPVGLNPQSVLVDRQGRVHVVCTGDYFSVFGVAYVIDPMLDAVIDSVMLGGSPGQASVGPDDVVFMAGGGFSGPEGYIFAYDAATLTALHGPGDPIVVDSGCIGTSVFQDGTVFASSLSDFVTRVDSAGNELNSFAVGDGPAHVAFAYVPGDVSGDFSVSLTDLTLMVNSLFVTFERLPWPSWRGNVNGDFDFNLTDLTLIVNHLFLTFEPLQAGPAWYKP